MSENIFPDYKPKKTEETIFDYNSDLLEKINEISLPKEPTAEDMDKLVKLLTEYKEKANLNQGQIQRGNIILGADEEEFIPSDDQLIESYIGGLIHQIIDTNKQYKLQDIKNKVNKEIKYRYIEIYHMDVMGSGRFFYANKPKELIIN